MSLTAHVLEALAFHGRHWWKARWKMRKDSEQLRALSDTDTAPAIVLSVATEVNRHIALIRILYKSVQGL